MIVLQRFSIGVVNALLSLSYGVKVTCANVVIAAGTKWQGYGPVRRGIQVAWRCCWVLS